MKKNNMILCILACALLVPGRVYSFRAANWFLGAVGVMGSYYAFEKSKPVMMRTHAGFHISRYYNKLRYGSAFTFHQMAGDNIHDGKITPLVLGSIPYKKSHIDKLLKVFGKNAYAQVGIFTLNEPWECEISGLTQLAKEDVRVIQHHYPTPDFTSPTLIDTIRIVRDLKDRDEKNYDVALVHCKAGRGRSAMMIAAYIAVTLHQNDISATPQDIEKYLVDRRKQVSLNQSQKDTLSDFIKQLAEAGSFEKLCEKYKDDINLRDAQFS